MDAPHSFTEALQAIAKELRENAPSHTLLNRAASQIDHLGRQLHGIGFGHDAEIANCFSAALRELGASHLLPEEQRAHTVDHAACHLDAALTHLENSPPSHAS